MAYDTRIWEKHRVQATTALEWRDKMVRNARSSGASGREKALAREAGLWEQRANHHLRRLAKLAYEAPDPAAALSRVEELRRWSGLSRRDLDPAHAEEIPILLGADRHTVSRS
jgi:hypothetical protein